MKEKAPACGALMAVWTRLELATSGVTGRHSNQLNYQTVFGGAKLNLFCYFAIKLVYGCPSNRHRSYSVGSWYSREFCARITRTTTLLPFTALAAIHVLSPIYCPFSGDLGNSCGCYCHTRLCDSRLWDESIWGV